MYSVVRKAVLMVVPLVELKVRCLAEWKACCWVAQTVEQLVLTSVAMTVVHWVAQLAVLKASLKVVPKVGTRVVH